MLHRLALILLSPVIVGAASASDTSVAVGKLEGVYRHSFQNSDSSGAKYVSENVFELVRVAPGTAYFSLELEFYNGHECSLFGIAESEKGALVHRGEDENYPGEPCVLRIVPHRGRITFEDVDLHCRSRSCGARGGYDGAEFAITRRRPVTRRLRAEAVEAIKEHAKERAKPQP